MNTTDIERIKFEGPVNFDEAQFVHSQFASYASAALVEGNAHEILRYLGELHEWGRQLVAARLLFREEELRRLGEVSPLRVIVSVCSLNPLDVPLSPEARSMLEQGIRNAQEGQTYDLGSFAQYADEDKSKP